MGTRSYIIQQTTDGKETRYHGIYCHWDGYLENNGRILFEHYNDPEKLKQLIALGDISSLRPLLEQNPDLPETPFTFAYHRDRGEDWEGVKPSNSFSLLSVMNTANRSGCEYVYLFNGEEWKFAARGQQFFGMSDNSKFSEFFPLEKAIKQLDQQTVSR